MVDQHGVMVVHSGHRVEQRRQQVKDMENTRTLAVQMPADLFERLDAYLASHKLKKKEFIISLVRNALDEEENAE